MSKIIDNIREEMNQNGNKISYDFIQKELDNAKIEYTQLTPGMRVCVVTLESGHEILGKAQVLDSKNDNEKIGNQVALDDAIEGIWQNLGAIAKAIM